MTGIALALSWCATLAFVAFVLWMRETRRADVYHAALQGHVRKTGERFAGLDVRVTQLEQDAASPAPSEPPDYAEIRETVSALALRAGLTGRK